MEDTTQITTLEYLKSLPSIRTRATTLLSHTSHLQHFDIDLSKIESVIVPYILTQIKRDYPTIQDIPPHSRWRHFEVGGINRISPLIDSWEKEGIPKLEITTRILDLFVISVLLDAGAGDHWKFSPKNEPNKVYTRSEGLALASLDWFLAGGFSSNKNQPFQVDSTGLQKLQENNLKDAFQVNDSNPLVGVSGRLSLLKSLGSTLEKHPKYFGASTPFRPGNMISFILSQTKKTNENELRKEIHISALWEVVIKGLSSVWPETRTYFAGQSLGDVWPCRALQSILQLERIQTPLVQPSGSLSDPHSLSPSADGLMPFHKLSQWLTYSLMEPMTLLDIKFNGTEDLTGLPEYRNGGLLIDAGVLIPKSKSLVNVKKNTEGCPIFNIWDDFVVEWRALTVGLLDLIARIVREKLNMSPTDLPLAKVLEAGMIIFPKCFIIIIFFMYLYILLK